MAITPHPKRSVVPVRGSTTSTIPAVAEILALGVVRYHQRRRRPAPMPAERSCYEPNLGIGVSEGASS
jgi:hypothetical protein